MKIGAQAHRSSSISSSNARAVIVRGRDLARELIGQISFTEHCWLLITGSMPSQAQRRMLDATLVAIAEHGLVPSVQASRMTLAAAPESLQGAVAAGILGCGSVVLGSSEAAGRFFSEINQKASSGTGLEEAVEAVIQQLRNEKRAVPGYGHPEHKDGDPRAQRLLELAQEVGVAGSYVALARRIEGLLPQLLGKHLKMNVSGAIAAVLLDAGFPLLALKGVPILARTAGLIAHLLEEQQRPVGFLLAHAGGKAVSYDGAAPEGFVPADE